MKIKTAEDIRIDREVAELHWRAGRRKAESLGLPQPPHPDAMRRASFAGDDHGSEILRVSEAKPGGRLNDPRRGCSPSPAAFTRPERQHRAELEIEVAALTRQRAASGRPVVQARAPSGALPPAPGRDPWRDANGRLPANEVAYRALLRRAMSPAAYEARMELRAATLRELRAADGATGASIRAAGRLTAHQLAILEETQRNVRCAADRSARR